MKDTVAQSGAEEFRLLLQTEYSKRCQKNSRYSLRAFAKTLRTSHAALSEILNKRRPLTSKMIQRLGNELGLTSNELKKLSAIPMAKDNFTLDKYTILDSQEIEVLSEWYSFAVLELIGTKRFVSDIPWISKTLNINSQQVQLALEKLQRLNLIEIKNEKIKRTRTNHVDYTNPNATSGIRKNIQKQFFEKALNAIDEVSYEHRHHSGVTMSIDSRKLTEARELIKKFRRKMRDFLGDSTNLDQVYHLGIALFPLTEIKNIKKQEK